MNAIRTLSMLWAASLFCALAGCAVAVPEEGEDDPALEEGAGEESAGEESASAASEDADDATSEASSEIQSEPASVVGCGGSENYCLARCSRSGDAWQVVGHWTDINNCLAASENHCRNMNLGYRTQKCWGHL